jgi:hypothetical protein
MKGGFILRDNGGERREGLNMTEPFESMKGCVGDVPDTRVVGRCDHKLVEIIWVGVCGLLCGAESWKEVEAFGEATEGWLKH